MRSTQLARYDPVIRSKDADRNQSGLFLERHCGQRTEIAQFTGGGEHEGGAYIRMAGKWNLLRRRENTNSPRMTGVRWKNKSGLRIIELARDLLHLAVREPSRPGQHGQRIPSEARLREHITCVVLILHTIKVCLAFVRRRLLAIRVQGLKALGGCLDDVLAANNTSGQPPLLARH